jgi:predicted acetyltransferase
MPEQRSEIFRPARPDEIGRVAEVVSHSFPSPAKGPAWWRERLLHDPHGGPENLWVAEEDGEIAASCMLLPLTQWISGVAIPTMGLGVVATAPTHRRRGLAGRMIASGLRFARERGDAASALFPFRIQYYEGLGYGLAGEAHQFVLPPRALPDSPDHRLRMRLVRGPEDRARLEEVYARGARLETGQMDRSSDAWRHLLEGDDRVALLYLSGAGEAEGYVLVRYRPDLPVNDRFLEVEERMWLTPAARRGVYAWLSSMGDQWPRIAYRAHPDERFAELVQEPRLPAGAAPPWNLWFPSATLLRGPMFRLLNVASALRMRRFAPGAEIAFGLRVDDPQIPENRGPWKVSIAAGRAAVEEGESAPAETLEISIRTLSRIFIGDLSPGAAFRSGAATIGASGIIGRLDAAFEVPRPWTFERF